MTHGDDDEVSDSAAWTAKIPSDQVETTTFVRIRMIFFDFEMLAMEEMGRIQIEQALNSSKRHVTLLTELQDKFEKQVKDLCSKVIDTTCEKCSKYVRDCKFTEKTLRDELDDSKRDLDHAKEVQQALRDEIKRLKDDLKNSKDDSELRKEMEHLRGELNTAEVELKKVGSTFKSVAASNDKKQQQDNNTDIEELKKKLSVRDEKLSNAEDEIKRLQEELKRRNESMSLNEARLKDSTDKLAELKRDLKIRDEELSSAKDEIERLEEKLKSRKDNAKSKDDSSKNGEESATLNSSDGDAVSNNGTAADGLKMDTRVRNYIKQLKKKMKLQNENLVKAQHELQLLRDAKDDITSSSSNNNNTTSQLGTQQLLTLFNEMRAGVEISQKFDAIQRELNKIRRDIETPAMTNVSSSSTGTNNETSSILEMFVRMNNQLNRLDHDVRTSMAAASSGTLDSGTSTSLITQDSTKMLPAQTSKSLVLNAHTSPVQDDSSKTKIPSTQKSAALMPGAQTPPVQNDSSKTTIPSTQESTALAPDAHTPPVQDDSSKTKIPTAQSFKTDTSNLHTSMSKKVPIQDSDSTNISPVHDSNTNNTRSMQDSSINNTSSYIQHSNTNPQKFNTPPSQNSNTNKKAHGMPWKSNSVTILPPPHDDVFIEASRREKNMVENIVNTSSILQNIQANQGKMFDILSQQSLSPSKHYRLSPKHSSSSPPPPSPLNIQNLTPPPPPPPSPLQNSFLRTAWKVAISRHGKPYYYNTETQEVTWSSPQVDNLNEEAFQELRIRTLALEKLHKEKSAFFK